MKFNEVELHYKRPHTDTMMKIKYSSTAVKLIRQLANSSQIDLKEFTWVVLMTKTNQLLGISQISIGNTHSVELNFREIFQLCLLSNATSIILCHNHPSGDLRPSRNDKSTLKKLKKLCEIMGINLRDNIILTSESHFSFLNKKLM